MNENKKTVINIFSSGGQVGLIGITYFILYKFLYNALGIELLGVWSVVMATTSIANLVDFGLATSVVRFVALYYDEEKSYDKVKNLVFTSSLFLLFLFGILSIIFYPFAGLILENVLKKPEYVKVAISIIPYSILCLILNVTAGVFGSVLDGLRKNYIRNIIFSTLAVLMLLMTYLLVPRFGLRGVVYSQLLQSALTLLFVILFVVKEVKYNPFKWQWDKLIFKEIFTYGIKFQGISLAAMFNEPITKLLLANFAGLQFAGYFEMAYRLIMQVRGVIINANQSLVPLLSKRNKFVDDKSTINTKVSNIYKLSFVGVFILSLASLTIPILLNEFVSKIWIGDTILTFTNILTLLSIAMFINLLCAPAYFALIANGDLNPILISQIIIAVINIFLGVILGYFFKGYGVVFGWLIAVIISTFFLVFTYQKKNFVKWNFLMDFRGCLLLLITSIICIIFKSILHLDIKASFILAGIFTCICILVVYKFVINNFKNNFV